MVCTMRIRRARPLIRRRRFIALPLDNVPFLEWIADVGAGPEQSAIQGEVADEMQKVLDALPAKYRAVLVLRYWYDFSYEEIANALSLTPALVKARLHRARELVARTMKAQGMSMPLGSEDEEEDEPASSQQPRPEKAAKSPRGGHALA